MQLLRTGFFFGGGIKHIVNIIDSGSFFELLDSNY